MSKNYDPLVYLRNSKVPNFLYRGISAKMAKIRYNWENDILNKNEKSRA